MYLEKLRSYDHWGADKKDDTLPQLINGDPQKMAAEAARKNDYRLIGLAMGYHASDKDAQVVGFNCSVPIQTQNLVFGCVPPPTIVFKLIKQYNEAMLQQPGFSYKQECQLDAEWEKGMEQMELIEASSLKEDLDRKKIKYSHYNR